MTSEQHYTVRVKGHTHYTYSRDLDVEYLVPNTVEPKDLLDYIKERVKAEDKVLEEELDSPTSSCESSIYRIDSNNYESESELFWEEGDDLMLNGDYLTPEEVTDE